MAKNQRSATLSISLPIEIVQAVYQQVRDGKYPSDDVVVYEALRRFLMPEGADPAADMDNPTARRRARRGGE